MACLREAITQGNARSVEELSHTLKGEVGYLGIATLSQEIRDLEQRGHKSELQGAEGLFVMFEAELSEVLTSIRRVVGMQPDTHGLSAPPGARQ
jgi:acetate kinase